MDAIRFVLFSYCIVVLLHLILPSTVVDGYCCNDSGKPLSYRLNGVLCLIVSSLIFWLVIPTVWRTLLHENYYVAAMTANCIGLFFSFVLYSYGGREKYARCVTVDQTDKANIKLSDDETNRVSVPAKFYLGHLWNPRLLGGYFDIKMILYLVGAVSLCLNIYSFMSLEILKQGQLSNAMMTYSFCFMWFIVEYLYCEQGDLMIDARTI